MKPAARRRQEIRAGVAWQESMPLWQRVPKRDEEGQLLTDFMMLAPGLNKRPPREAEILLMRIHAVLERHADGVAYADFNLRLNLLWVSLRHRPGLLSLLVAELRGVAPQLKLVAHHVDPRV